MTDKKVTKKSTKPVDKLTKLMKQPTVQEQFKNALGRGSDLFVASLIDVFNDKLTNYDPSDVIKEALRAATLKLPITKSLGLAYLIPYNGKVQFQIGYKGLLQLAMRTGQVKNIHSDVVYDGEWKSTDKLRGTFDLTGIKESDKTIGYFAYLELINGFEKTVYWTKEKIINHATEKSPNYGNKKSAWTTDFDAMAKKTVLRALFSKYAPMSIEFADAMMSEEDEENIEPLKNITPLSSADTDLDKNKPAKPHKPAKPDQAFLDLVNS